MIAKQIKTNFYIRLFLGVFIFSIFSFLTSIFFPFMVEAVEPDVITRDSSYSAKYITQSEPDPIQIEAGANKVVTISFKNTGSATWNSEGAHFISAYTMEDRYHDSIFAGNNWISKSQTSKIIGVVFPNQTGTLVLNITAPNKIGEYIEHFYLASENNTWVKGGYFFLKFNVIPKKEVVKEVIKEIVQEKIKAESPIASTEGAPLIEEKPELKAKNIGQNVREIYVVGGEQVKVISLFQNIGETSWKEYAIKANTLEVAGLTFADSSWQSESLVLTKSEEIAPSKSIRGEFFFRAPSKIGEYVAEFPLTVNSEKISGVFVKVIVHVTKNAPSNYNMPLFSNSSNDLKEPEVTVRLEREPSLRVGMELPMSFAQFRSEEEDYNVIVAGEIIGVLPKTHLGVFKFDGSYYNFVGADVNYEGPAFVRLEPVNNQHAIFKLLNYERRVSWKGPNNFNTYRGAFEYREGKVDKKLYAVNDLLIEDYVAGIGETSNVSDIDYIKALLTAARTYAYEAIGKYPFFDVLGNTYDQLYLGYESERLMNRVLQAQKETRGYMVTYEGEIVVTPYFANSAGTTKSWAQVWGGRTAHPWLVPVSAGYDRGQPLRGHGVGMSARDSAIRADKEGIGWEELLKYYYTGVKVEKIYY